MCYKTIKLKSGDIVPCGRCPLCKGRRIAAWAFRLQQQERVSENSHFITLTYGTENLKFTENGRPTLAKRDVQLFIKRLRKLQSPGMPKLKYYCAGEYGSKTFRPHYHIIIFNCCITTIQPAWSLGDIHYGQTSPASIAYSLKYISKPRKSKTDDRANEFQLNSKGLGANYLTPAMIKWHKSNLIKKMYCTFPDNIKISMPRYYKDKIYTREERTIISNHFQAEMQKEVEKFNQLMYSSPDFETLIHNKQQGIAAAYDRMYQNSTKNTYV